MHPHPTIHAPNDYPKISIIDREFDRFDLRFDMKASLRAVETTTFYHDTLDPEE